MEIGTYVEYETGIGEYGIGVVTKFDEQAEIVTVTDEDDGSTWCGPADRVTPAPLTETDIGMTAAALAGTPITIVDKAVEERQRKGQRIEQLRSKWNI